MSNHAFFLSKNSYHQLGPAPRYTWVGADFNPFGQSQVRISSVLYNELARPLGVQGLGLISTHLANNK